MTIFDAITYWPIQHASHISEKKNYIVKVEVWTLITQQKSTLWTLGRAIGANNFCIKLENWKWPVELTTIIHHIFYLYIQTKKLNIKELSIEKWRIRVNVLNYSKLFSYNKNNCTCLDNSCSRNIVLDYEMVQQNSRMWWNKYIFFN